jgi:hypothetical protein
VYFDDAPDVEGIGPCAKFAFHSEYLFRLAEVKYSACEEHSVALKNAARGEKRQCDNFVVHRCLFKKLETVLLTCASAGRDGSDQLWRYWNAIFEAEGQRPFDDDRSRPWPIGQRAYRSEELASKTSPQRSTH